MKKHITTTLFIITLLAGLSLLLYPTVSDWWNSLHQSRAIAGYTKAVAGLDEESYEMWWEKARQYNEELPHKKDRYRMTEEEKEEQQMLRKQYIEAIRTNMRANLNNISIQENDGSITDLGKKFGGIQEV